MNKHLFQFSWNVLNYLAHEKGRRPVESHPSIEENIAAFENQLESFIENMDHLLDKLCSDGIISDPDTWSSNAHVAYVVKGSMPDGKLIATGLLDYLICRQYSTNFIMCNNGKTVVLWVTAWLGENGPVFTSENLGPKALTQSEFFTLINQWLVNVFKEGVENKFVMNIPNNVVDRPY